MSSAVLLTRPAPIEVDQRVQLHGIGWKQYEMLLDLRGENAGPRMTYLEGELELMSPSREHEMIKEVIGQLLETFAEERGLDVESYGSMTMRSEPRARGVEPDKCYAVGGPKESPDLAIEVDWTSGGGLNKLEAYRGLGVREIWVWKNGNILVHALRGDRYHVVARSALLPTLDLAELTRFSAAASQSAAVRAYRAVLKKGEGTATRRSTARSRRPRR